MSAQARETNDFAYPPLSYAVWVVFVLLLVTLSSLLDRQLPALLVRPIKESFGISDTAFSMVQGSAFALFYTVMGLPFGRLVDRTNRRNLIIIGLTIWSLMTAATGFAQTYWQLLGTRIGVGIGEACLAPAAYSIIADYFPAHQRARATSAYYMSLALGAGASMLVGGLVLPLLPPEGLTLPGLGLVEPWRLLFLFVGFPGLLLLPLLATVKEPVRRETGVGVREADSSTMMDFLRHAARHRMTFACIFIAASAVGVVGYANIGWASAFFDRRYGIPAASSAMVLGLVIAVGGLVGTLLSGVLSDYWTKQGRPDARFRVMALTWVTLLPASICWPLLDSPSLNYVVLTIALGSSTLSQAAGPVILQEIVPNRMRGQAIALYLLFVGLMSLGLGPTAPALFVDNYFHDESKLGYALACVGVAAGLVGPLAAWLGLRAYARSWAEVTGGGANARPGAAPNGAENPLGVSNKI